jgi:hypothetical protein
MESFIEGFLNDAARLLVNFAGGLFAVVALFAEVAAQKDQLIFVAECHWTDAVAHAVLSDH